MTGLQFRLLRNRLGLSQAKLADQLGMTANSIARLERGERTITDATAKHARLLEKYTKLKGSE